MAHCLKQGPGLNLLSENSATNLLNMGVKEDVPAAPVQRVVRYAIMRVMLTFGCHGVISDE
jgi:hypothetical protein